MITLILLLALILPVVLVGGILALFMKRRRRSILRWSGVAYAALALAVLFGAGPYALAWAIAHSGTRPPDRVLKDNPGDYGIAFEDIAFRARDSLQLSGWFVPPSRRNAVVICTHGLFRNRVEVLSRGVSLARAGYGVLLYDSRSHGASDKSLVTLGYAERNDVLGAMDYVVSRFQDAVEQPRLALMGVSMGAVATAEAASESDNYSALILDSPFLSLRDTVARHSWLLLKLPRFPFPSLFLFWFQQITGADPDRINTLNALRRARPAPLLVIASEGDERMGTDAARLLYAESRAPLKKIKIYGPEVPHGAAARIYPQGYASVMLEFLEQALGGPGEPVPELSK